MPDESVSLRDFLALKGKVDILEAIIEERRVAMDRALQLQFEANEKHFTALNGEQDRLAADRGRFVLRETYELSQKENDIWKSSVNNYIAADRGRDNGIGLSWGVIVGVGGLLIGAGVLMAKLLG